MALRKTSRRVEIVETHNITLSLSRIHNTRGYDDKRWKRALYHALGMSGLVSSLELTEIRNTLKLP